MKVTIDHKERTTGLLFKKTWYVVCTTVEFSAEERAVLQSRNLREKAILTRPPSAMALHNMRDNTLETAVQTGYFNLTIDKLLKSTDEYECADPVGAQVYEQELTEALKDLKKVIELSAVPVERSKTFEL